tara:strand:+ start:1421 stop:1750 length:330 start_codon:yes stop_codon:yes gene_type:complete
METRHIKLTHEEALNAKKQLLSSEINLLYMLKKLTKYRLLRKKEFAVKNKLKVETTALKSKLNILLSTLPNNKGEPRIIKRKIKKKQESVNPRIAEELEDIQEKLAKLK